MAYVFFPPRVDNFFPAGPPYLSGMGLHGLALAGLGHVGLGDYAADLAAYQKALYAYRLDKLKWNREKLIYESAKSSAVAQGSAQAASYGIAMDGYTRDKAAWDKEYTAYLAAMDTYNTQYAGIKQANTARALTISKSYGLSLPQSFFDGGACLSQSQHDAYARTCVTVKGLLGTGLGSQDPDCGYKALPVCNYPTRPTVRAKPSPPAAPTYPKTPTLRAEPVAPTAPTAPAVVPRTTPTLTPVVRNPPTPTSTPVIVTTPEPTSVPDAVEPVHQANMVRNGLLLVAVLGGGYLVYRTLKKPKAA